MKIPVDPLPHVRISGTSRECGVSLGNTIRNRIEHSLRTYQRTFELCDMSWAAATDKASGCREIVEQYCPHLLAELEGLADGSGIDEESLFTLNCRTEILPSNFLARAMAKDTTDNHSVNSTNKQQSRNSNNLQANECTSFAFTTEQSSVWLAQNWDWVGMQRNALAVVESRQPDRPAHITVTEAGMLAKIGINDKGLGITLNILRSHDDGHQPGMPVHFLLQALLDCSSVQEACDFASSLPFASSSNVMIAQSAGSDRDAEIASIELSPEGCRILRSTDGTLCHTNHFLHPELTAKDAGLEGNGSTIRRLERAQTGIAELSGMNDIKNLLSDTSDGAESICRFPDSLLPEIAQIETVVGVAMDLADKTLWVTGAQPSISEFIEHRLE